MRILSVSSFEWFWLGSVIRSQRRPLHAFQFPAPLITLKGILFSMWKSSFTITCEKALDKCNRRSATNGIFCWKLTASMRDTLNERSHSFIKRQIPDCRTHIPTSLYVNIRCSNWKKLHIDGERERETHTQSVKKAEHFH